MGWETEPSKGIIEVLFIREISEQNRTRYRIGKAQTCKMDKFIPKHRQEDTQEKSLNLMKVHC